MTRLPPPPLVGPVVDADGHVVEAPSAWAGLPDDVRPRIEPDAHGFEHVLVGSTEILAVPLGTLARPGSTFSDPADVRPLADAQPGGSDPVARLADMDAEGIDQAVLFPTIALYLAVVEDPAASVLLARAYNDWLADYCAAAPRRLFGAALLPLQDPVAAPAELRRAVTELGFPAAFVRPNPCAGRSLCHRDYEPLWDTAEELGVPLGVHEGSSVILPTLGADRPFNPLVLHAVSHPFEEMLACAQLIAFGVLERHPGLRFVFLESGGGWAPFWLERLDEQAESFGGFCPDLRLLPSEYFARQCAVSFEVDERTLPALLPFVGRDRVVWGSDYPHHDATFPGAVDALRRTLAPLVPADQARVLGHNARRLYGLPSPHVGVAAPVHDYFAAVTLRDPDLLAGVLAPRAVLTVAGRRLEGTEAILDFYRTGAFAFDDLRPDPGPLAVEGGTVTVPIALHLGGTDTEVEDVFTVAGDRITALDIRGLAPEVQGALRRAAGEASRA